MMRKEIQVHLEQEPPQTLAFDRKVTSIEVDGYNLSDVHDLTEKVAGMTKTIKILAITALTICVICAGMAVFVTQWLLANDSAIQRLLLTSSKDFDVHVVHANKWRSHERQRAYIHLEEFHGLHWDEGMQDWVSHSIVKDNLLNKVKK